MCQKTLQLQKFDVWQKTAEWKKKALNLSFSIFHFAIFFKKCALRRSTNNNPKQNDLFIAMSSL